MPLLPRALKILLDRDRPWPRCTIGSPVYTLAPGVLGTLLLRPACATSRLRDLACEDHGARMLLHLTLALCTRRNQFNGASAKAPSAHRCGQCLKQPVSSSRPCVSLHAAGTPNQFSLHGVRLSHTPDRKRHEELHVDGQAAACAPPISVRTSRVQQCTSRQIRATGSSTLEAPQRTQPVAHRRVEFSLGCVMCGLGTCPLQPATLKYMSSK